MCCFLKFSPDWSNVPGLFYMLHLKLSGGEARASIHGIALDQVFLNGDTLILETSAQSTLVLSADR